MVTQRVVSLDIACIAILSLRAESRLWGVNHKSIPGGLKGPGLEIVWAGPPQACSLPHPPLGVVWEAGAEELPMAPLLCCCQVGILGVVGRWAGSPVRAEGSHKGW